LPARDAGPTLVRASGRTSKGACGGPQPMANRRNHPARPVEDLRLTIDCMPVPTRQAMLDGVQGNERIIVGAYVDGDGGVCPMLAAHRGGGRTDLLSFARAWDRFTRAGRRARRATRRELDILVGQLKDSLVSEADVDLDRAIEEHRALLSRHELTCAADPIGDIVVRGSTSSRPAGRMSSPAPRTRGIASTGSAPPRRRPAAGSSPRREPAPSRSRSSECRRTRGTARST
jgi:hypothetical protein